MRVLGVQEAAVRMNESAGDAAPGAAITLALCGSWTHEPPCPLAPHHTQATREGDRLELRVLFAVDEDSADLVRGRIVGALAAGSVRAPDGTEATWELLDSRPAAVRPEEHVSGRRLAEG